MKKRYILLSLLFLSLLLGGCNANFWPDFSSEDTRKQFEEQRDRNQEKKKEKKTQQSDATMEIEKEEKKLQASKDALYVDFIDVGQADATLIRCDGHAMLIDAGDNSEGTKVQLYLKKQGVEQLDYVIGTHPDSDHVGGLDVIITKFDCGRIFAPEVTKDTVTWQEVLDAVDYRGYHLEMPECGETFQLGTAVFEILSPEKEYSDSNDNSIVIRLEHGENTFLFAADAQESAMKSILKSGYDVSCDVYKVAHHGSSGSFLGEFYDAMNPEYAVISCGAGNSYGHPHAEVLNELRSRKIKVFRTDEQGSIQVRSNGKELVWNTAPSESWQSGR